VPAHIALDTPGLFADPQLQHRGHFVEIAHDIFPAMTIESSRLRLSGTPAPSRARSLPGPRQPLRTRNPPRLLTGAHRRPRGSRGALLAGFAASSGPW
jgi:hypothetical protein